MIRTIRVFLLFEAATFVAAALVHFGALLEGYRHREAGTAETAIAVVLLAGLALTWSRSRWVRRAAIGTQVFAILGVLAGLFTIAIGVGPQTMLDILYHVGILAVLIPGFRDNGTREPSDEKTSSTVSSCQGSRALSRSAMSGR